MCVLYCKKCMSSCLQVSPHAHACNVYSFSTFNVHTCSSLPFPSPLSLQSRLASSIESPVALTGTRLPFIHTLTAPSLSLTPPTKSTDPGTQPAYVQCREKLAMSNEVKVIAIQNHSNLDYKEVY